jgi:ABC-type polysaccharide/polyol phosphate export permease
MIEERAAGNPRVALRLDARVGEAAPLPQVFLTRLRVRSRRLISRSNWRLLVELVRAEHKVGEYSSALGLLWSLLGPGAMLLVMYSVFSKNLGVGVESYPLYLLLGVVVVSFFLMVTRQLTAVFAANAELLVNATASREMVVLSKLAVHVYKFGVEIVLCVALSAYYGLFSSSMLLAIPLLVSYLALAGGIGLILALVFVFARDVEHIWGLVSRLLFFATPVFYGLDTLPEVPRALLYWLNPLTPFLLAFRDAFMGTNTGGWGAFCYSLLIGPLVLAIGYSAFLLLEGTVVERA